MITNLYGQPIDNAVFSCGTPCPHCGDTDPQHRELRNYDMAMHDGDIHCTACGGFVRLFDAG